jgi:hypothetical protein
VKGQVVDALLPAARETQLVLDENAFPIEPVRYLISQGALTAVGLDMTKGGDWSEEEYEKLGVYLGIMNRSCMWWIGDWLLYGEGRFGERWSQIIEVTKLAEQTLLNRMYVCRQIPMKDRKLGVSFSVHAVVAGCKTAKEMRYWLGRAEKGAWSVQQLREAMRAKRSEEAPPLPGANGHDPAQVLEIARVVWDAKTEYGADFLVPREPMARLGAALGVEE